MTEKPQFKHVPHGTNSPPLEATGEDKPMGASCIAGTQQAGHVSDAEQRQGEIKILVAFVSLLGHVSFRVCLLILIFLLLDYFPELVSNWHWEGLRYVGS